MVLHRPVLALPVNQSTGLSCFPFSFLDNIIIKIQHNSMLVLMDILELVAKNTFSSILGKIGIFRRKCNFIILLADIT